MNRKMITAQFEDVAFQALEGFPEFLDRNLMHEWAEVDALDYETVVERICFLSVAAIARAAYLRKPNAKCPIQQADRAYALDLIESGCTIVLNANFEELLQSLGASVEAITGFPARRLKAEEARRVEIERKRKEVEELTRYVKEKAPIWEAERLAKEAADA